MHRIQTTIISRLDSSKSLRYSDLQIPGVGSNLFTYHLKALKQTGLVMRTSWGTYTLTQSGKRQAGNLDVIETVPQAQPTIVILIACQNYIGQWLVYKRLHNPLINQVGFPVANLVPSESILLTAERELEVKTGLRAPLTHKGDGYITIGDTQKPDKIISQIMFHAFYGVNPTGHLKKASKTGEAYWTNIDEDLSRSPFLPSMPDLIQLFSNSSSDHRFFAELKLNA